jgi:hypothetical protein
MLINSLLIFDDFITGTSTWYTATQFNATLGSADVYAIQACTTMVTNLMTQLTVQMQSSADGQFWFPGNPTDLNQQVLSGGNEASYTYSRTPVSPTLALVRFAISLTGGNQQCYLKLYFTGRVYAGRPGAGGAAGPARRTNASV